MRPPVTSYNDGLFVRAVELGCCPANWGTGGVTTWVCMCDDKRHGAGGPMNALTEGSLGSTSTEVLDAAKPIGLETMRRFGMEHFEPRPRRLGPGYTEVV